VARAKGRWQAEIKPLNTHPYHHRSPKMPQTGPGSHKCRVSSCKAILESDYALAACPSCLKKDNLAKKRRRDENKRPANISEVPATLTANPATTSSLSGPLSSHTFNVERPSTQPDDSTEEEKPSFKRLKVCAEWYPPPFSAE
jgi:hypothetical protein